VLFALGKPAAFAGLLTGFVVAMVLRGVVQRLVLRRTARFANRPVWDPRHDFDIYGAVAAVIGGTGWGRRVVTPFSEHRPRVGVALAGPAAVLVASQIAFGLLRVVSGPLDGLQVLSLGAVLHGWPVANYPAQFLLHFAVALLAAGLLALVPLPPLDGWALVLRAAGPRPSPGFAKAQHWLDDNNVGVVILLIGIALPLIGSALVLYVLGVVAYPVFLLWSLV
jgi:hypothetical protein